MQEGYFDDESAEVVISSLRLGDDQGSLFTNSNWFAFQNDDIGDDDAHGNATSAYANGNGNGNSSSDDEVVVGEDDELTSSSNPNPFIGDKETMTEDYVNAPMSPPVTPGESVANGTLSSSHSSDGSESSQKSNGVASLFEEDVEFVGVEVEGTEKAMEGALKEGIVGEAGALKRKVTIPNGPDKDNVEEGKDGLKEFNDTNYWKVDQDVEVLE